MVTMPPVTLVVDPADPVEKDLHLAMTDDRFAYRL